VGWWNVPVKITTWERPVERLAPPCSLGILGACLFLLAFAAWMSGPAQAASVSIPVVCSLLAMIFVILSADLDWWPAVVPNEISISITLVQLVCIDAFGRPGEGTLRFKRK